jgi:hypothetical protein
VRRTAGLGLIGAMGALAMMRQRDAGMTIDVSPDEPPIEAVQKTRPDPRAFIAAIPPRPYELTEADRRALAAADAKRQRRAEKRKPKDLTHG